MDDAMTLQNMADRTGLEPAISDVTGQRIYRFYFRSKSITHGLQLPSHHYVEGVMQTAQAQFRHACYATLKGVAVFIWSGRSDSNRRHRPWQGSALPLSYARKAYNTVVL